VTAEKIGSNNFLVSLGAFHSLTTVLLKDLNIKIPDTAVVVQS